jgi:hypothetical protein
MEPYESLANAVIVQAVKDYRQAIHFLNRHPHTPDLDTEEAKKDKRKNALRNKIIKSEGERDSIERFFRSEWFELLSNLDGEVLLDKVCDMEVD